MSLRSSSGSKPIQISLRQLMTLVTAWAISLAALRISPSLGGTVLLYATVFNLGHTNGRFRWQTQSLLAGLLLSASSAEICHETFLGDRQINSALVGGLLLGCAALTGFCLKRVLGYTDGELILGCAWASLAGILVITFGFVSVLHAEENFFSRRMNACYCWLWLFCVPPFFLLGAMTGQPKRALDEPLEQPQPSTQRSYGLRVIDHDWNNSSESA